MNALCHAERIARIAVQANEVCASILRSMEESAARRERILEGLRAISFDASVAVESQAVSS